MLKSHVAIERVGRIVALRVGGQIDAVSVHRAGSRQECVHQRFAQAVAACLGRHGNRGELTGSRRPFRFPRLNPVYAVQDLGGERGVAQQCGKHRQYKGPPRAPHQAIEFRGIHEAADQAFQRFRTFADQHDSRAVVQHQVVVAAQKIAAQLRQEELAEGLPVNVHDAGKIFGCGLAHQPAACTARGPGQRNCVFAHSYRFLKCNRHSSSFVT